MDLPPWLSEHPEGTVIEVFVQPRAAKNALVGVHGAALKLKISAPPVEGRANKAAEEFFAGLLGVPKSRVGVVRGESSRHKRIVVGGISAETVARLVTGVLSSRPHERR